MDLEHVALTWCVRFAGQINSRTMMGAVHFSVRLTLEPCFQRGDFTSEHQEDPYHRQVFSGNTFLCVSCSSNKKTAS